MSEDQDDGADTDSESDESDGDESNLMIILENLKMETQDIFPIECILTKDAPEDEQQKVFRTFCFDKIRKEMTDNMDKQDLEEMFTEILLSNRNAILAQERVISVSFVLNLIKISKINYLIYSLEVLEIVNMAENKIENTRQPKSVYERIKRKD